MADSQDGVRLLRAERNQTLKDLAADELASSEVAQELLSSEVFQEWMDTQLEDAKSRCVRVVETHSSNYEKAMAAGILRYWRSKRREMETQVTKEYRQKRITRLEKLNGGRESSKSGPVSGIVAAYGQF